MKIEWLSEHDDALMTLLGREENLTFSEIHKRMVEQFALPFTRNGCIGRAHRLRLPPRPTPRKKAIAMPVRVDAPILPKEARRPPNGRDLTIYQLGYDDCRYPAGERPPYSYCGEMTADGRSYCPKHCAIVYHAPNKRWY
jgi:hypothetical protein